MEKHIDVMKQSLVLVETLIEGLEHIQILLKDGSLEQTLYLVEDIIVGYSSIEKSVLPIAAELGDNEVEVRTNSVKVALRQLANAYEARKNGEVQEVLQFHALPEMKKWQRELQKVFSPYLLS